MRLSHETNKARLRKKMEVLYEQLYDCKSQVFPPFATPPSAPGHYKPVPVYISIHCHGIAMWAKKRAL